ncbi:MAG: quinone oxidoreductase [Acidobacteriota bacterium]|nr:quinone oxidoreductase [Acidobacteriota bacterium]
MRAIQIVTTGGPEVMHLAEVPAPVPGPQEALVRVEAAGVNFIDVYFREGRYAAPLPYTLGQEGAGTVEAVGSDVESVRPGDRVAWCMLPGSYAEFCTVPADRLVPIPAQVSAEQAAAAMLQGCTAHYLADAAYRISPGDEVLVHAGAGGSGLLLTQMAKSRGARVYTTVSTPEKAALSRAAGADHVILYTETDFAAEVSRLTAGRGVAAVYDSVGATTFDGSLRSLRPRGTLVLFGASSGAVPPLDLMRLMTGGSLFVTRPTLKDYVATRQELLQRASEVLGMVASGDLRLRTEHTYPLAEAAQAHRDLQSRRTTGKLLLIP